MRSVSLRRRSTPPARPAAAPSGSAAISMAQATSRRRGPRSINSASTLNASAIASGDGGTVAVWSDATTSFAGQIAATGGAGGGNGGYVEVSANPATHGVLDFTGGADLTAPNGATGTLLLDPYDITSIPTSTSFPETQFAPGFFRRRLYARATSIIGQRQLAGLRLSRQGGRVPRARRGNIAVDASVDFSNLDHMVLEQQPDTDCSWIHIRRRCHQLHRPGNWSRRGPAHAQRRRRHHRDDGCHDRHAVARRDFDHRAGSF